MKTVIFHATNSEKLGVKTERGILDVEKAKNNYPGFSAVPVSASELIYSEEKGKELLNELTQRALQGDESFFFYQEDTLELAPCVTNPQKIICIGLNYRKHAIESNMPIPEAPIIFSKFNNALAGHRTKITLPARSEQVDYEAELTIIIGRKANQVRTEDALSYVYGYCIGNDLSARDLQTKTPQWLLGKTCDGFAPIGPYLVSKDEISNPDQLNITTKVNGELRQSSNTSDMIFSCKEIIAYLSDHMTLYPGDIIMTGTPEGVILGYPEKERYWLKDGDEVTIEIANLGRLTNQLAAID
ncbi:fumarylacetoacetate hydrolase family protein [Thalassobacillus pellis]|uniref:fumarylacetoacetate hydrolase family protein n=1 Tax=Thalassobacillus pellis TaxID=748008 RepID=UPI001961931C|nr:fumarylacetoacetate hydrolase family protein [Thalassobacillus pellis]MBM7551604.1 2-keto-4-pentenoate hydratase/2-oxohepta-3-ene-1,7-dioic acid hydratase in catechol pathway [Thalassobacillus pellis]